MKQIALTLFVCTCTLLAQSQQWTTAANGTDIYNANTGNVGIGTSTPQYKLDLSSSGSGTGIFAAFRSVASGSTNILELKENNYVGLWRIYPSIPNRGLYIYGNPNDIDQAGITISTLTGGSMNNANTRSMVRLFGYTIGNTSSSGNFTFNNLAIEPTISNTGGTTVTRGIYYNPTLTAVLGTFKNIAYENVSGINILNSVSGNTLVGTSTDNGSKLQVSGTTWTTALQIPTGAAAGKVLTSDASGNATWQTATGGSVSGWSLTGNTTVDPATTFIGTTDNTTVSFRTGNNERFRIDGTTGNLLVGKTSQASTEFKLDINGSARATRMVVVATNGADFVFEHAYRLSPLPEVEAYIRQNHHLPDITPAAQMQKEGIDVASHETKLLQKIEELTLYIIEQDKTNKTLQNRLDRLEKMMERNNK